jgi:hypothetical protein
VYLVWGSTYLAIRYMVETVPALMGSGLRFVTAGLVFAAFLAVRHGPGALRITPRELAGCAAVGVALLLGGNGLVAVAEDYGTPSGLTALVVASCRSGSCSSGPRPGTAWRGARRCGSRAASRAWRCSCSGRAARRRAGGRRAHRRGGGVLLGQRLVRLGQAAAAR